ncbi:unnamed protein product, partial [Allacma fusca]
MSKIKDNQVILNLELQLRDSLVKLEIPVELPFEETKIPEFTQLIITSFDLPIIVEDDIAKKLSEFVEKENLNYLTKIWKIDEDNVDQNIKVWEQSFRDETLQYNPPEVVGDDEVFAEAYHSLVHSPMLGTLLRKESALNSTIREMHR